MTESSLWTATVIEELKQWKFSSPTKPPPLLPVSVFLYQ
jgi:hypothetical protein